MSLLQRKLVRLLSLSLWLLAALLPSQPLFAQQTAVSDHARDKKQHMDVLLTATLGATGSNQVDLTLRATPLTDAPALQVRWLLPEGSQLVGGPTAEATGAVAANQVVQWTRQLHLPGPGLYKVMAAVGYSPGVDQHFGATGVLFITIAADSKLSASDKDPNAHSPMHTIMPMTVNRAVDAAQTHNANGDPCFFVSGRVMRTEMAPTQNGSANNPLPLYAAATQVPVRYAHIEMREEDTLFDDSYGDITTGADGRYSFSFCDDDGVFDDELEIYVRLHAEIKKDGHDVASIEDDGIIDDVYEFNSGIIESEGGTYVVDFSLDNFQSAVMNIGDAVYEAWQMWNDSGGAKGDDAIFDGEAEVHYEPGDGVSNSFYNGYFLTGSNLLNNNDISIADDPSDPDPWDDSVIMHEWGHQADDFYGCDDNGGGPHNVDTLVSDQELSWGEGYPDYWQSAVRDHFKHGDPSWYLDVDGSGVNGIAVNLETYDNSRVNQFNRPDLLSDFNELAIAAMLWDLYDNNNDARTPGTPALGPMDRVAYGHQPIQEVYTDPFFESNGDWFDDTCTNFVYLWSWLKLGKPTDAATAEAVTKNIGRANPFGNGTLVAANSNSVSSTALATSQVTSGSSNPNNIDPRWWQQLTMIVDNSASMGQDGKLDAVKTLMHEQINDVVAPNPKGVEVRLNTFSNLANGITPITSGQFFPDSINPYIDQITARAEGDILCQVNALDALAQGVQDQHGGQAWIYTDGDTYQQPSLPNIRRLLNQKQVRGSFALLGGCGSPARKSSDVSGEEKNYLQLAADGSQPGGIVPYLLTALGSGGQFLYVNKDQLGDAKEILRAQLANSAGAGRWSDYVSDVATYRWDQLTSREYQWFPAESLGQDKGQLFAGTALVETLPAPVPFYGSNITSVGIDQDGFMELDPCTGPACPIIRIRRDFLDLLHADLVWGFEPYPPKFAEQAQTTNAAQPSDTTAPTACATFTPGPGPLVRVFTANLGFEWHIISVQGCDQDGVYRAYQVWLNDKTGEIRYQYDRLRGEAANAEIGLRQRFIFPAPTGHTEQLLVSNKDANGAKGGMGYKFTPAPPAPTRIYTVAVDSLIDSVGFLQTGYSGDFEVMQVTDPAGNPVNCADTANVLCVTVDHLPGDRMVQYVQVNTQGRGGNWHALIDAGASGQATFSFSALAASALGADSPTNRLLPSKGASALAVHIGRAADGNLLTGWLQMPNGARWGSEFTLFDDGAHGDGRAGDGRFGLPDFTPPGAGVGFLWVKGLVNGNEFQRADPVPFNFQPFKVTIQEESIVNNNLPVDVNVQLENLDSAHDLCVNPDVTVPENWSYKWDFDLIGCLNIPAGQTRTQKLTIYPTWEHAPSLSTAEVTVAFAEDEEGGINASDSVTLLRQRPAASLAFDDIPNYLYLRPNSSDAISLTLRVLDDQGAPVADDTLVEITTNAGDVMPGAGLVAAAQAHQANGFTGSTQNGRLNILFTPGSAAADATVLATLSPSLSATVTVQVRNPLPNAITLSATPTDLSGAANTAALLVTVRDPWGNPAPGATVRIGAEGDGQLGLIEGGEVITHTANAQGQVLTSYTKAADSTGKGGVRAELLVANGSSGYLVAQEARLELLLSPPVANGQKLYLPHVRR
jgi:hypothetical protein